MVTEKTPISAGVNNLAITMDDTTEIARLAYRSKNEKNRDLRVDIAVQRIGIATVSALSNCSGQRLVIAKMYSTGDPVIYLRFPDRQFALQEVGPRPPLEFEAVQTISPNHPAL